MPEQDQDTEPAQHGSTLLWAPVAERVAAGKAWELVSYWRRSLDAPFLPRCGEDQDCGGRGAFLGETEIYFMANRKNCWEQLDASFRVAGKRPELWDPIDGITRDAARYSVVGSRTTLPVKLAPYGSLFVVFRKPAIASKSEGRNFLAVERVQELGGPWTVQSDAKWGWPASVVFEKLDDWSKRKEDGIKFFSGTASYQKSFDLPEILRQPGRRIYLDLGDVKNVAEVKLNGTNLGVVWTAPRRVEITQAVKPKDNVLEIAVTNLWWNRLVGDAGLPENERLTKTNVRLDKNSPLLESGLLGPVTLQATAPDAATKDAATKTDRPPDKT